MPSLADFLFCDICGKSALQILNALGRDAAHSQLRRNHLERYDAYTSKTHR
jgi:hypothetical protein